MRHSLKGWRILHHTKAKQTTQEHTGGRESFILSKEEGIASQDSNAESDY